MAVASSLLQSPAFASIFDEKIALHIQILGASFHAKRCLPPLSHHPHD
jgi:hypothetical protein